MGRSRGTGPLTALVVVAVLAATTTVLAATVPSPDRPAAATTLVDVADRVGLDTRHGAFRWGPSPDAAAMMGGGVCWLDADNDGWQIGAPGADAKTQAYDKRRLRELDFWFGRG